jgi:predicted Zn-dependent protease
MMAGHKFLFRAALWLMPFCLLLLGCAVNPVTKRTELMLVSEEQEFQIGQRVDKQVREEMGVYLDLPELRSLVKQVGENIGRNSDRPNIIYRMEIADAPDYNAFALPGGFVYVHRGLLERLNSVDELAAVLGHEIAHVAARHSAAQISKVQLFNLGLAGLSVATGGALQNYGQLLELGAVLAFNKFSRDAEREADFFGTRYVARAGYNPLAAVEVMRQIQRLQTREPTQFESWFLTHPPSSERLVNINQEINSLRIQQPVVFERPMERNRYVSLLDGLVVGEWNGNELIRGDRYYNKEFLLSLQIPEGWTARINSKRSTAVFIQPKKELLVSFDIEPLRVVKSTSEYFRDFEKRLESFGLKKVEGAATGGTLGQGALSSVYQGYDEKRGSIAVAGMAFVKGVNGYSLIGSSKREDFGELQYVAESMMNSIQFMSQKEASELKPPRIRIHRVGGGETWTGITQKYFGSPQGTEKLAEYNGLEILQNPPPGALLKIPPSLRFE